MMMMMMSDPQSIQITFCGSFTSCKLHPTPDISRLGRNRPLEQGLSPGDQENALCLAHARDFSTTISM